MQNKVIQDNREKFQLIQSLNFPVGQYAITGSGPMGIRNLREINDIDIIVVSELWNSLSIKYGIDDTGQFKKIAFLGGLIEVFCEWVSFHTNEQDYLAPTIADRIAEADIIEGLPFESLKHTLYFKRKMGREKDLKDILIIEAWLEQNR